MTLNNYKEYDSIWFKEFAKPVTEYYGPSITSWKTDFQNKTLEHNNYIRINFELENNLVVTQDKYPDSFLIGLARLGGLIAILRIGSLLNVLNKFWFNKALLKDV